MRTIVFTAIAGLALAWLGRAVLLRRGLIDRWSKRRLSDSARAREAWQLTEHDGITPIRPGTRSTRGGTDGGRREEAAEQHEADPASEAPGRHAAPIADEAPVVVRAPSHLGPLFFELEAREVYRSAERFVLAHPDQSVSVHARQADQHGREIVN